MPELTPTILVVQGSKPPIDCFPGLLREIFPSSRIGVTEIVKGGIELIEVVERAGTVYDVAVVDIEPLSQKESQGISDGLCEILKEKMPWTLVVHTGLAEADEESVWSHLERDRRRRLRTSYVCRAAEDWQGQLIAEMKEELFGRPIEKWLDCLFGMEGEVGHVYQGKDFVSRCQWLMGKIVAHWDGLSGDLQQRIMSYFFVDNTRRPITVSLPAL